MKNLICPISDERINEQVTRLNAFFTVAIVALSIFFDSAILMIFLAADFYIRAFTSLKYSPISFLSVQIVSNLNLPSKIIDKAPKVFAARLGFIMSALIAILLIANLQTAAFVFCVILGFFATFELTVGICVGCLMYSYLVLPFYKN